MRVLISIENSHGDEHPRSRHFEKGLDTVSMPNERTCREMLSPRRMARAGSIESDQETIPRRVHLPATEPRQLPSHNDPVLLRQFTPFPVTNLCCLLCRVDDIGEKNCCQKSMSWWPHQGDPLQRLSSTLPSLKQRVSMITDDLFCGLV